MEFRVLKLGKNEWYKERDEVSTCCQAKTHVLRHQVNIHDIVILTHIDGKVNVANIQKLKGPMWNFKNLKD